MLALVFTFAHPQIEYGELNVTMTFKIMGQGHMQINHQISKSFGHKVSILICTRT